MGSWRWVGLAVTACLVVASASLGTEPTPPPAPAPSSVQPSPAAPAPEIEQEVTPRPRLRLALQVLAEWDERRAAAWRDADAAALRRLYTSGSSAAAADLALLRRWERSGWRVERLDTQVLRVRLLHAGESRVVLRLRDRLTGGALRRGELRRALPSSTPVTRTVTLVDVAGSWRVSRTRLG